MRQVDPRVKQVLLEMLGSEQGPVGARQARTRLGLEGVEVDPGADGGDAARPVGDDTEGAEGVEALAAPSGGGEGGSGGERWEGGERVWVGERLGVGGEGEG